MATTLVQIVTVIGMLVTAAEDTTAITALAEQMVAKVIPVGLARVQRKSK
jgi:hypothetical protein